MLGASSFPGRHVVYVKQLISCLAENEVVPGMTKNKALGSLLHFEQLTKNSNIKSKCDVRTAAIN